MLQALKAAYGPGSPARGYLLLNFLLQSIASLGAQRVSMLGQCLQGCRQGMLAGKGA